MPPEDPKTGKKTGFGGTPSYTGGSTHGYDGPGKSIADRAEQIGRGIDEFFGGDPDTYRERTDATKERMDEDVDREDYSDKNPGLNDVDSGVAGADKDKEKDEEKPPAKTAADYFKNVGTTPGLSDVARGFVDKASAMFTEASEISREAWDTFQTYGKPAFEALWDQFNPANQEGRIATAQGLATQDVRASYATAENNLRRAMGRYGMNPGSGRFAAGLSSLARGEAADLAGARTTARMGVLDRATAGLSDLAGMTSGIGLAGLQGQVQAASGMRGLAGLEADADLRARQLDLQKAGMEMDYDLTQEGYDVQRYGIDKGVSSASADRRSSNIWGLAGLAAAIFSDRRIKRDIVEIGEIEHGLKVYEFSFINDPEDNRYTGLMADEVHKVWPQHVGSVNGIATVDYFGVFEELAA